MRGGRCSQKSVKVTLSMHTKGIFIFRPIHVKVQNFYQKLVKISFLGNGKKPTEKVNLENSLNSEEKGNKQHDAIFGIKSNHLKNKVYVMLNIAFITAIVIVSCYLLYRIWNRKRKNGK